jgi:multidrug efflux system membrane fusion protein
MEARQLFLEEWTEIFGTTQPLPELSARVTAPVEGQVISVLQGTGGKKVVEGQEVRQGQIIARLDPSLVRADPAKYRALVKKWDDQEKQARVAVDQARVEVTRLKRMKAKKLTVPESDLKKAELLLKDALLKQEALKTDRENQLGLFAVTSPLDGRLGRLLVAPGQVLARGALIADVINIDKEIDVLCFVPPHVARRLKKGMPARVGALGEGASSGPEGKVEFIADQAEVDTGNFAVKVRFPNDKLKLRANTTIRLRIRTTPGKACLALPESAILEDQDPPAVIVVEDIKTEKKDDKEIEIGKARKLQVKLGIRDRVLRQVEILSVDDKEKKWKGNMETAKFVIERGQGLRTGDAIKVEEEEEEEEGQ